MRNKDRRRDKGTREGTQTDVAPAPTAATTQGGVTPLASTATIETVHDAPQSVEASYDFNTGEKFHDYAIFYPRKNSVQLYGQVVALSHRGMFTSYSPGTENVPADTGHDRIDEFYGTLYDKLVQKAVIRDGYRHLPDTQTVTDTIPAYCMLWVSAVRNLRTLLVMINNVNWNNATRQLRSALAGLYRRASEDSEALKTFQMPSLYQEMASFGPPLAMAPNGTVLFRWVDITKGTLGTLLGSELALGVTYSGFGVFKGLTAQMDWGSDFTQSFCRNVLIEVENIIRLLRYQPATTFVNVDSTDTTHPPTDAWQTSARDDMKYFVTLLNELVYPPGVFPDATNPIVDPASLSNLLFGEALIMNDEDDVVGFPAISLAENGLIPRRGYGAMSMPLFAGLMQPWAISVPYMTAATWDHGAIYGSEVGWNMQDNRPCNHDLVVYNDVHGYSNTAPRPHLDDADDITAIMVDGSPTLDHQWNAWAFAHRATMGQEMASITPASYQFHMPYARPAEFHRAALCASWNVPYTR